MKKKNVALLSLSLGCATLLLLASDTRLRVRSYAIHSPKINTSLRLCLLTDLHSEPYGKAQETLLARVRAAAPDLILLGGDILDDALPHARGFETLRLLAAEFPCYYVSGNHEVRTGEVSAIKDEIRSYGITVLEGDCISLPLDGTKLALCGIDDPDESGEAASLSQLDRARTMADEDAYRILLTHRPELIDQYRARDFDLVLAGHAHGGQWRIPGLLNGLIAPHQGLFPAYAGGLYEFDEGDALVVSRGLSTKSTRIPRFFNPTELVLVDLLPPLDEATNAKKSP